MSLRLVPLRRHHARRVRLWENHPDVAPMLLEQAPVSLAQVEARISDPHPSLSHRIIEVSSGGVDSVLHAHPVGVVTLGEGRDRVRWGSFEIVVGPRWQGRGVGRRVLSQVPGALKAWRGLSIIKIGVYEDNARARALYESLGYEVVDRVWYGVPGGRRRVVLMSNTPEAFVRRPIGF